MSFGVRFATNRVEVDGVDPAPVAIDGWYQTQWVRVAAATENEDPIYVGEEGTKGSGLELLPGDYVELPIGNVKDLFVFGTNGDVASVFAVFS